MGVERVTVEKKTKSQKSLGKYFFTVKEWKYTEREGHWTGEIKKILFFFFYCSTPKRRRFGVIKGTTYLISLISCQRNIFGKDFFGKKNYHSSPAFSYPYFKWDNCNNQN
jgi:hypothetical protein